MSTAQIRQVKSSSQARGTKRTDPLKEPRQLDLVRTVVQTWPTERVQTAEQTGPRPQTDKRRTVVKPIPSDALEATYTVKAAKKAGSRSAPVAPVAPDISPLTDEDGLYDVQPHTSALRYTYQPPASHDTAEGPLTETGLFIQRRRLHSGTHPSNSGMTSKAITTPPVPHKLAHTKPRRLPLIALIVGMLAMLALVVSLNIVGSWWQIHQDDVQYGRPRTFQMDAVVGHNDSTAPSHFIFLNLNRHVEIIELPGGDASHAHIYPGPVLFGDGQDLTPVTGQFRDVNGDGRPDMIVQIQQQRIVFINTGTMFRSLMPGERVVLPQS